MINERTRMPRCDHEQHASLYGLGLLEEPEIREFENHLNSCRVCEAEVRQSGDLAVELAGTPAESAPPERLRVRVLAEAVLPRGVLALVRGAHMRWQPTKFQGVSMARLYEDPLRGEVASLVRMTPGAHYPSHRHVGLEHCYVLQGDLIFEDHTLHSGDYAAGTPDRVHTAATTETGCMLFIVHNVQDQLHA